MTKASIPELEKEMEKIRCRLHALVNGDVSLLLDKETYRLSMELDKLIVNLMQKEQMEKT